MCAWRSGLAKYRRTGSAPRGLLRGPSQARRPPMAPPKQALVLFRRLPRAEAAMTRLESGSRSTTLFVSASLILPFC